MNFKARVKQQFSRAAPHYDQAAHLQHQCVQDLASMLPPIAPEKAIDLGTGTGYGLETLRNKYPLSLLYGLDLSEAMLRQVHYKQPELALITADFDALPFIDQSVDLMFSNLALQWSPDLQQSLKEAQRVLKPNGTLLFSTLVAGSMLELNATQFLTPERIFLHLEEAGFVLTTHMLQSQCLYFAEVKAALYSLKKIGANACVKAPNEGLYTRARLQQLESNYPKEQQGYPLSYCFLFVSARKTS